MLSSKTVSVFQQAITKLEDITPLLTMAECTPWMWYHINWWSVSQCTFINSISTAHTYTQPEILTKSLEHSRAANDCKSLLTIREINGRPPGQGPARLTTVMKLLKSWANTPCLRAVDSPAQCLLHGQSIYISHTGGGASIEILKSLKVNVESQILTTSVADLEFSRLESWSRDVSRPVRFYKSWSWSWSWNPWVSVLVLGLPTMKTRYSSLMKRESYLWNEYIATVVCWCGQTGLEWVTTCCHSWSTCDATISW